VFEKLVIRNFQAHRDLTIELDPHITTLWGSTDQGKSAVIRALIWACLNQRPDDHIHWDADWTKVELHVDGQVIVRKQGKSNTYRLNKGHPSKSFNKGVPAPIADLLKVSQENFQQQHDSHFWISLSAGKVSKELNKIINLEIIDESLSEVASRLRTAQATVRVTEKRLEDAREKRAKLRWVKELDAKLQKIEQSHARITDLQTREQELTVLITKVQGHRKQIRTLEEQGTKAKEMVVLGEQLSEKVNKLDALEKLIRKIKTIIRIKKIEIPNIELVDKLYNIEKLITEIEDAEQWVQSRNEKLTILETSYPGKKYVRCA
jgi:exonuclease SbcC